MRGLPLASQPLVPRPLYAITVRNRPLNAPALERRRCASNCARTTSTFGTRPQALSALGNAAELLLDQREERVDPLNCEPSSEEREREYSSTESASSTFQSSVAHSRSRAVVLVRRTFDVSLS